MRRSFRSPAMPAQAGVCIEVAGLALLTVLALIAEHEYLATVWAERLIAVPLSVPAVNLNLPLAVGAKLGHDICTGCWLLILLL